MFILSARKRNYFSKYNSGHAVDQEVSRRLSTAVTQVRSQIRLSVICGGQIGTVASFLLVLRFPLPLTPSTAPRSSS
jgi:hypothetical protein